jgi:hypothetical protein
MSIVLPAEGVVLERILSTTPPASVDGLRDAALARFDAAMGRVPWAVRHQRQRALLDGTELLASAHLHNLTGVLDKRPVRICGVSRVFTDPAHRDLDHGRVLVERLMEQATREGADLGILFASRSTASSMGARFEALPMVDIELTVSESSRHGAPMVLVRGGEDRDLAAIVAMGRNRATRFRFHLERDAELVKFAISRRRLRAGLGEAGVRELQFVIAEEGITAAAYAVISVFNGTWTIEECGDRDPSGARLGAILQALIAREPAERRPVIRGWLPPGFLPPQATVVRSSPAKEVLMLRYLGTAAVRPRLTSADVLYWRGDHLS